MASIVQKVEEYLGEQVNLKKCVFVEKGGVESIETWRYTEKPKPTTEQLDALNNQADLKAQTKANNKTSAQNKLKALGLTDAEIEAL
jgi:hypothetical protein